MAALRYALSPAASTHATLTLLHAVDGPAALESEAWRVRLRALIRPASTTVLTAVVEGEAWRDILRFAADRRTDLVVLGVERRGALDLAVFGSTTHRVRQGATCPVLTVASG